MFTDRERAALAIAEAVTLVADAHLTDADYDARIREHHVLVDTGEVAVDGHRVRAEQLLYRPPGSDELVIEAVGDRPARVMLLGGQRLDEQIVMRWNLIGRTHEEVVGYRAQWQAGRAGGTGGLRRFGEFPDSWSSTLAAPELPNARLRPRE